VPKAWSILTTKTPKSQLRAEFAGANEDRTSCELMSAAGDTIQQLREMVRTAAAH
jgi:hypothetical protein